ncbi:hypothetical protein B0F90DRAFT_1815717 [Multifurca ochricompacta]|uniref:Uncharacterized protein n=1 Tax=Multifurca ochricompacta TaxID=376703 RepID=A0AAD4M978_9AGAM|nr:hypothetical protein B0F90DRAFT_1815717 [Multifurca ochricompacta]
MAPLAGRPPFATDEPESVFAESQPQGRYRQPPKDDPNSRTSAYNHYDGYLNNDNDSNNGTQNKHGALVAAIQPLPQQMPVPLAAPKPGYAAPIAALVMPQPTLSSSASPEMSQFPPGITPLLMQSDQHGAPRVPPAVARPRPPPVAPISVPSTPHPLPPTMTPILPVFARPVKPTETYDVKWGPEPILRGNSEEKLLPRRGEKGDDFWRRFSMVAREENKVPYSQKQSAWLRKTQDGTSRMSRWLWVIGLILLACAGLGIGVGWYISHKSPPHQDPTAFGGGANYGTGVTNSQQVGGSGTGSHISSPHVTPTNTVARRAAFPDPLPTAAPGTPVHVVHISHPHRPKHDPAPARHQKRHLRRAFV